MKNKSTTPRKAPKSSVSAPSREEELALAREIVQALQDTKGEEILLIDLAGRSPVADFVVIATGRSQAHVRGLAAQAEERTAKTGVHPAVVEGMEEGSWVLMDYQSVILHLFHPETRRHYDLESLLEDYPRLPVPSSKE
ncbi:MAG: ribosome silencing factor [Deltaproteobacteria bacterium]|nr:ribosome silencing factor [Deltaproteobacteria bacterium]